MTEATFTAWACGCTSTTPGCLTADECPCHDSPVRSRQTVNVTPHEVVYGHRCSS